MRAAALGRAIRFYRVVPPVSPLMRASFIALTAASIVAVVLDPESASTAAVPILVLQVFAASAGFAVAARRGHYDVLLTGGVGRLGTALVHWMMSVAPGVACCLALGTAEVVAAPNPRAVSLSGTFTALFVVSTMPWAMTVAMPRFTGAIGWMLVFVMVQALVPQAGSAPFGAPDPMEGSAWVSALTVLLFPIGMAGRDLTPHVAAVLPVVVVSGASMAAALVWIHVADVPLEAQ